MADLNPIQLQKYLKGANYPLNKNELVKLAEKEGADQNVKNVLAKLPDKTFDTPADVSEAVGKIV